MDVTSTACGPYQIHHNYYKDCTKNKHGRFKLEYSVRYVIVMGFVFSFKHLNNIMSFLSCQDIEPIGSVMVSMVASSAVDLRFEAQSIQAKDNKKRRYLLH
jgi:hypothetical protein